MTDIVCAGCGVLLTFNGEDYPKQKYWCDTCRHECMVFGLVSWQAQFGDPWSPVVNGSFVPVAKAMADKGWLVDVGEDGQPAYEWTESGSEYYYKYLRKEKVDGA